MSQTSTVSDSRVLIVDDEPTILDLYALELGDQFDIDTTENAESGLSLAALRGPYAVVVADRHMPGMSGSDFLRSVEDMSPDTVRIMLTADGGQGVAVEAVNQGQVFRFLNKPCPPDELAQAIRDGIKRYQLAQAERELLSSTLNGSVKLLVQILSVVSPLAFGRATRIRRLADKLCERLDVQDAWEVSIAALLSQLGCVGLPDTLLRRVHHGESLTPQESALFHSHPHLAHDLISEIPRLNRVADIIVRQQCSWRELNSSAGSNDREIAFRAGFLRVAIDYDALLEQGRLPQQAVEHLAQQLQIYHPDVLSALADVVEAEKDHHVREILLCDLQEGMILESDIADASGVILITKGQELARVHLERLRRQKETRRTIREPIRVLQAEVRAGNEPAPVNIPATSVRRDSDTAGSAASIGKPVY